MKSIATLKWSTGKRGAFAVIQQREKAARKIKNNTKK